MRNIVGLLVGYLVLRVAIHYVASQRQWVKAQNDAQASLPQPTFGGSVGSLFTSPRLLLPDTMVSEVGVLLGK